MINYCWKRRKIQNHHHLISPWLKYIVKGTLNTKSSSSHFSMINYCWETQNQYLISPWLKYIVKSSSLYFSMINYCWKRRKTQNHHHLISPWLKYCWKGCKTQNHHHLISPWLKYCKDVEHQTNIFPCLHDLNTVKGTLNTKQPSHFSMTLILLKGRKKTPFNFTMT